MTKQTETNTLKIAIQGVAGCFHDAAAREFFNGHEIETVECTTFDSMFELLQTNASLIGIVAIENTIAGSLLANHERLRHSGVKIFGEHKMRISHVIAALPGQSIEEITEVNSHPMALAQCEAYLKRHPHLKIVEHYDTAGSAKDIADEKVAGHAAICSAHAAKLYGLEILEEGIETNKHNYTRFLLIAAPILAVSLMPKVSEIDKASLVFTLPHREGALSKVLTILSFYDINLSKIQSMPIVGREWEYRFYIDVTFSNPVKYHQSIEAVRPLLNDLQILGEYSQAKSHTLL